MKIPRWHILQWVFWSFTGLPLQWFFTAFNGLPFLTLPDPPPFDGSAILWLFMAVILYHPFLLAPLALWRGWSSSKKSQAR